MMQVTASTLAGQRFRHGLALAQLDALAATAAAAVMFPAGQRVIAEGGSTDKFWLVESGYVALDVPVPGERPEVIGTVGIGGLLGWQGPTSPRPGTLGPYRSPARLVMIGRSRPPAGRKARARAVTSDQRTAGRGRSYTFQADNRADQD